MQNQIDAKERELKSCRRRADDLSFKLDVIRRWCEWLTQPPGRHVPRPNTNPYFEAEECRVSVSFFRAHSIAYPHFVIKPLTGHSSLLRAQVFQHSDLSTFSGFSRGIRVHDMQDSSRWRRAFDEVCRLEQKIGSIQNQRRSHPVAVRLNSTTTAPNASKSPPIPPSTLPLTTDLPPKPANDR
ncbi:unnamed protein product [Rodentolepis nana]|uniref:BAG domain-containing protein n=1 Tax=Rodentolepis nana TaxID=102285 RepID=A0A0R3TDP7_RODNA|nr:unnamed protein product [Rodentolepis nana]